MAQLTQLLPEVLESPDYASMFIGCMVPFEVGAFVPFGRAQQSRVSAFAHGVVLVLALSNVKLGRVSAFHFPSWGANFIPRMVGIRCTRSIDGQREETVYVSFLLMSTKPSAIDQRLNLAKK